MFDLQQYGMGKELFSGQLLMFVQVPILSEQLRIQGIPVKQGETHAVVRLFEDTPLVHFRQGQYDRPTKTTLPYSQLVRFWKVRSNLYLVPCTDIKETAIVVPNLPSCFPECGGNRRMERIRQKQKDLVDPLGDGFFVVRPREEWGECFSELIESFPETQ
jgi:hypothetical protein